MMYTNREEAGLLLAEKLMKYQNDKDLVVVAIPRGGVPIGAVIAKKINAPLEIVLSKKIGHPLNKEYAIGAVTLKSSSFNKDLQGVSKTYIEEETKRIRNELEQRYETYFGIKKPMSFKNKTIILVDDGVATGNTLMSSLNLIQQEKPLKVIVALPVSAASAYQKIKKSQAVDSIICLLVPTRFDAVGQFYQDFFQVNNSEVIKLLKEVNEKYQLNN